MSSYKRQPEPNRPEYWPPHMMSPGRALRKPKLLPKHTSYSKNSWYKESLSLESCQFGRPRDGRPRPRPEHFGEQPPEQQMLAIIESVRKRTSAKMTSYAKLVAGLTESIVRNLDHLHELFQLYQVNRMPNGMGKRARPSDDDGRQKVPMNGNGNAPRQSKPNMIPLIVLDDSDQSDHETVTAATVVKRRKSMPMSPLPSMPDLSSPFYTPLRQKSRHSRHSSAIAMGKRSTDRDWDRIGEPLVKRESTHRRAQALHNGK